VHTAVVTSTNHVSQGAQHLRVPQQKFTEAIVMFECRLSGVRAAMQLKVQFTVPVNASTVNNIRIE